jgi:hypothetical protein
VLAEIGDSFSNYQIIAKREAEQRSELSRIPASVATVPFFPEDICDLAGLLGVAEKLWN